MGTNYYLIEDCCKHCGRGNARLHIGKSSAGWCFGLHHDEENGLCDLAAWEARWSQPNAKIEDEYGVAVSPAQMRKTITERKWNGNPWEPGSLALNDAIEGPSGLARHAIRRHCVAHGNGTYDLIRGEFS